MPVSPQRITNTFTDTRPDSTLTASPYTALPPPHPVLPPAKPPSLHRWLALPICSSGASADPLPHRRFLRVNAHCYIALRANAHSFIDCSALPHPGEHLVQEAWMRQALWNKVHSVQASSVKTQSSCYQSSVRTCEVHSAFQSERFPTWPTAMWAGTSNDFG